jgi:hypothetical protein
MDMLTPRTLLAALIDALAAWLMPGRSRAEKPQFTTKSARPSVFSWSPNDSQVTMYVFDSPVPRPCSPSDTTVYWYDSQDRVS